MPKTDNNREHMFAKACTRQSAAVDDKKCFAMWLSDEDRRVEFVTSTPECFVDTPA